jgi:hypothetical protein
MPLAVAALPALILAVVGMIILWGLALLLKSVLQSLANHVPLIGGALSGAVGAIIDQAVELGASAARAVVSDAVGFLLAPVYWIERHIASVINFFTGIISAIGYLTRTLIPDEVATLESDILTSYHDAVKYTQSVASLIYATLAYDVAALERAITAAESAALRYAQQLAAAAEAYTAAAIAAETRFVQASISAVENEIAQVATAEARYAQTLYTDAITYTQTLVTQAETTLATDIRGVIDWTGAQVTALDAAIGAMGTRVIALTLDAVQTVESDLEDLKSECTDNLCSGLSDLASLLNALTGDLGLAALFALAGQFAADPRRAAADVHTSLGPVAADAAGVVRTLIGL